ncbi:glycoside hydrolase [Meira miltonrushii]|uniref:Glycoside hydrolase n=1 Tax=Meira miltonrushii TaxID=1280837 RepID=A0A316V3S8_9BASI|nr:glycoside hydrolase [Meira miltonrushii]PWN32209.1 glycoside hydrolase [Meira miltonrushii]
MAFWTPPLSTRGRYIVDANGKRFKLIGGNWHGASGTYLGKGDINDPDNHHAGEVAFQTPLCLDRVPIDEIVQSFIDLGITTIRLPFSNEMIHSTTPPPDDALRANPQFRGMTPLEIFDACIKALTKRGLAVILNNHTVKSIWCCGVDVNARWNGAQTDIQWQDDWVFMAKRYQNNSRVVGAELYNEVRRDFLADPTWGSGTFTDWWNASQTAGTRILREANSQMLIIVEGINFVGIPTKYTQHYRPELQPVGQLSHSLPVLDKLVYSSHFYSYTGPNATGGGPDLGTDDPLYRDLSASVLDSTMRTLAFYVSNETQKHYSAPVWISEFGSAGRTDYLNKDRWWWKKFTNLLEKYDADFAIWPLLGWMEDGHGDGWAMNMFDANAQRLSILDPGDWRLDDFSKIVNGSDASTFSGIQSNRLYNEDATLSQPGLVRASCPDGLRLHGLSHEESPSGLCTDAKIGRNLWDAKDGGYTVITTEKPSSRSPDWAPKLTKFQCSTGKHMIGYSFSEEGKMESIICAQNSKDPSAIVNGMNASTSKIGLRTIYFGKQTDVADDRGQWFGLNATAATCADDEILIGTAFTTRGDNGRPQAILCQNFKGVDAVLGTRGTNAANPTPRHSPPTSVAFFMIFVGLLSVTLALLS